MRCRVKICGITSVEDARLAADCGADAIGLMFYAASPRCVPSSRAAEIVRALPPLVAKVGVFVNEEAARVLELVHTCGLDTVQLHGDESPDYCASLRGVKCIKAFRVRDRHSLDALPTYATDAWLLDSYVAGQMGGTGERFNWDLAVIARAWARPILLAGGLTPDNVTSAIRTVRPFGVDVSSGVESSPGHKDPDKLRRFLAAVRSAGAATDETAWSAGSA